MTPGKTDNGKAKGGILKHDKKIGSWIVWPENIEELLKDGSSEKQLEHKLLNATALSKQFKCGWKEVLGHGIEEKTEQLKPEVSFREKFEAKHI